MEDDCLGVTPTSLIKNVLNYASLCLKDIWWEMATPSSDLSFSSKPETDSLESPSTLIAFEKLTVSPIAGMNCVVK